MSTVTVHLPGVRWTWEVVIAAMNQINVDCKDEERSKQQTDECHQRPNYEKEANRHVLSLRIGAQLLAITNRKSSSARCMPQAWSQQEDPIIPTLKLNLSAPVTVYFLYAKHGIRFSAVK